MKKTITTVMAAAVFAVPLAACSAGHGTHAADNPDSDLSNFASPVASPATTAAPATQAALQSDPNGQECASLDSLGYCAGDDPSPMQTWCDGSGYTGFQTVESDLSQLDTDSGNNDLAAVESDGATLFQDANAASHDPNFLPPLSNAHKVDYGVWMGYLMVAGEKASTGDISSAASAMQQGSKFVSITE